MRISRTKNATRNVIFGIVLKIYSLFVPFLMRTAMIYLLGVEYLGLNSLFTSILQVLNLAELGVGSAMVFSMYKPIADDDENKICSLMRLYRLYYRIIGGIVLIGGLAVLPFLQKLISGNVPDDINIYILYILNLMATVFTYWLFAYRNSIFQAYQRTDIISKVTLLTDTFKYIFQIAVLAIFHNYYYYIIAILFSQVINNITTAFLSKKMYPQYEPKGTLDKQEIKEIQHKIIDLFTAKIGGTIVNSADTIVISTFLGLRILAIYQNYYYIVNALMGIVSIIFSSVVAGSGNSFISESEEKNFEDFRKITFITYWIVGFAICGMMSICQPFMKMWVGKNLMLPDNFVLLLCIYFWGLITVLLVGVYKDAAGIWHEDRFRPLISGLINLFLNLILVNYIGLYGIVISTIISVIFVSVPWITRNVFTYIFPGKFMAYIKDIIFYIFVTTFVTTFTVILCNQIPDSGIWSLLGKIVLCASVCNGLFVLIYWRISIFRDTFYMVIRVIKK